MASLLKMPPKTVGFGSGHLRITTLLVLLKTAASLVPGATFHSAAPGIYFQYVNVPGQNEYIFGFSRGNPDHHISRYEHGKGSNFEAKVIWTGKHGGSGEHCWDYNHIDKGKGKNEYEVYGNNGFLVGEHGSLGETYGNLKGSHGSTSVPSVHESGGGDGHINLGNDLLNLGGGHVNLGDSHVDLGDGHVYLGDTRANLGDSFANLEGGHVNLGDSHADLGDDHVYPEDTSANLGDSSANLEGGHVNLGDSHVGLGDGHVYLEDTRANLGDSYASLEGGHVRLLGGLSDSYANPGDIHSILSNSYGGFSDSNSILGSLGSIYVNLAGHYKSLEDSFIHDTATHDFLGGKLKEETGVDLPTYETSGETTSDSDMNRRSPSSTGNHKKFCG